MSRPYAPPTGSVLNRPIISEVIVDETGRWFQISFAPGQALPPHRNSHSILIQALSGVGLVIAPSCGRCYLAPGDTVRLEPRELHEVAGGPDGLVLRVNMLTTHTEEL